MSETDFAINQLQMSTSSRTAITACALTMTVLIVVGNAPIYLNNGPEDHVWNSYGVTTHPSYDYFQHVLLFVTEICLSNEASVIAQVLYILCVVFRLGLMAYYPLYANLEACALRAMTMMASFAGNIYCIFVNKFHPVPYIAAVLAGGVFGFSVIYLVHKHSIDQHVSWLIARRKYRDYQEESGPEDIDYMYTGRSLYIFLLKALFLIPSVLMRLISILVKTISPYYFSYISQKKEERMQARIKEEYRNTLFSKQIKLYGPFWRLCVIDYERQIKKRENMVKHMDPRTSKKIITVSGSFLNFDLTCCVISNYYLQNQAHLFFEGALLDNIMQQPAIEVPYLNRLQQILQVKYPSKHQHFRDTLAIFYINYLNNYGQAKRQLIPNTTHSEETVAFKEQMIANYQILEKNNLNYSTNTDAKNRIRQHYFKQKESKILQKFKSLSKYSSGTEQFVNTSAQMRDVENANCEFWQDVSETTLQALYVRYWYYVQTIGRIRAASHEQFLYDIYLLTIIQYFGLQKIPKSLLQKFEVFMLKYSSNGQANSANAIHFINHYNPSHGSLNTIYGIEPNIILLEHDREQNYQGLDNSNIKLQLTTMPRARLQEAIMKIQDNGLKYRKLPASEVFCSTARVVVLVLQLALILLLGVWFWLNFFSQHNIWKDNDMQYKFIDLVNQAQQKVQVIENGTASSYIARNMSEMLRTAGD